MTIGALKGVKPLRALAIAKKEKERALDPGFIPMSQIPETAKESMLQELAALLKVAATPTAERDVTPTEAKAALTRLRKLDKDSPTAGQLARGAGVGAVVGPASSLAWRAIAGKKGWAGTGKLWPGTRPMLATSGQWAFLGGAMPAARHKLEQEVEKQRLKEYLGYSNRGKLRSKIKKTTGL